VRGEDGIERPLDLPGTRLTTRLNRRPLAIFMGPRGGGIDFELEIPPGAVFQGDVGMEGMWSERAFHQHPRWTRIVVSVGRDGAFERLRSAKVGFGPKFPSGWVPMEADLSRFAGSRVTLRLEAIPRSPVAPGTLSWIGSPRIATRVEPGPPAP
jgi:hypothetical protein